jgi:serine/threonine-protein kinase
LDSLEAALADRYRIERELGEGGMATVYLADDLRHERQVALKVLKPELAALLGAERFLSEIKTTAALRHPGFLFYVMPYVEGETLRDRLRREGALEVSEALAITRDVTQALDYAHGQSVIHRDVKPENILLGDGGAVVADFGIALAVSEAGGERLTETGLYLGTPTYMSPEQATGESDATPASDVYSLACLLYEMLSGEPPFAGATLGAVLAKVVSETPPPIRTVQPDVSSDIEAAIVRGLARLPEERFQTAAEFAGALGPTPAAAQARAGMSPRRRQMFIGGAVVGVLLLAIASVSLYRQLADQRWVRQVAIPEIERSLSEGFGVEAGSADCARRSIGAAPAGGVVAAGQR